MKAEDGSKILLYQHGEFTDSKGNVRECIVRRIYSDGLLKVNYWNPENPESVVKGAFIGAWQFRP